MAESYRLLAMGDLHSGHVAGLTPPPWQFQYQHVDDKSDDPEDVLTRARNKCASLQREGWDWFTSTLNRVNKEKQIDGCLINGDAVDGPGKRSGGTECVTTDMNEQCKMAEYAIRRVGARDHYMTYGTPYHTGTDNDYEVIIANNLGAKIGPYLFLDINGCVLHAKHEVSSSSVPHGRHTALAKARLWNQLWSAQEKQPEANVYIRSHVHYHCGAFGEGKSGEVWEAMSLPALQAAHTKFGARRCEGTVSYGFVVFDVEPTGAWSWKAYLARHQSDTAQTVKVV